ncbi:MAG: hypothetical protein IKI00_04020 [Bacteroidales bacterium]|nr:hypothetical protein [Bacteroidales bacterium]
MKKRLALILCLLAGILLPSEIFGQAQIYTRKEKLKDITAKTTKVVLNGDEMLNEAIKESVAASWTMSPYEFCSVEEFEKIKTSDKFYFLLVAKGQQRKESEPGIDFLTLVKGGEDASKSINDMLEVVSFPLRSASEPSGREFILLPAFLSIIQEHAQNLTSSEVKAYSTLSAEDTKKLAIKQIYFSKDDFAPQVDDKTIESLDQDIIVKEDEDDVDEVFTQGTYNAVISYVVAPTEPVNGSVCYKLLIGADNHKLYWYKKHRISARSGRGFLAGDLRTINQIRK